MENYVQVIKGILLYYYSCIYSLQVFENFHFVIFLLRFPSFLILIMALRDHDYILPGTSHTLLTITIIITISDLLFNYIAKQSGYSGYFVNFKNCFFFKIEKIYIINIHI